MTTQLNNRVSARARAQLDALTAIFESQRVALEMALDLAHREYTGGQAVEIIYGFHGADLFTEDEDWCDYRASVDEYARQVEAAIVGEFPGASVEVKYDYDAGGVIPTSWRTSVDGYDDHDDVPFIDQIAANVFEAASWMVGT